MIDAILVEIDAALGSASWTKGPPVHPNAEADGTRSYAGKCEVTGWTFLVVAWVASRDMSDTYQARTTQYGFAGTASRVSEGLIVKLTPELAEKAARLGKARTP